MSLIRTVEELHELLQKISFDLGKVPRGNKSAAQRIRVYTLALEKVGRQFRKQSMELERPPSKGRRRKKKGKRKKIFL